MKLFFTIAISFFLTTSVISQTKFDEMKNQYDEFRKEEKQDSALAVAKRINKWAFEIEKDTSLHYAVSFRYIGNCFLEKQVNDSAIFYYNRSLDLLKLQKREIHKEYASCLNNLGVLYWKENSDFQSAISLLKDALEIRRSIHLPENPNYIQSLENLGDLYADMGNLKAAYPLYKEITIINKNKFGLDYTNYGESINNLSILLNKMGDYKATLPLFNEILEITKKEYGVDSINYAICLNNLGMAYSDLENFEQAIFLINKALKIIEKQAGKNKDYYMCFHNLAILYEQNNSYSNAKNMFDEVIKYYEIEYGINHPKYADCLNNLSILTQKMGDYKVALTLCEKALQIREKVFGVKNPDYANSLINLASLHIDLGDYKSALEFSKSSIKIIEETIGKNSLSYANKLITIGKIYFNLDNYEDALLVYKEAEKIILNSDEIYKIEYAAVLNYIGVMYYNINNIKEAKDYFNKSILIYKDIGGNTKKSLSYSLVLCNLGSLYINQGEYVLANELLKRALNLNKNNNLNYKDNNYSLVLNNLANLYSKTKKIKKASYYYKTSLTLLNKKISTDFEWLNDNSTKIYWIQNAALYNKFDEFTSSYYNTITELTELSYNNNLITKGKLLESKLIKDNVIASPTNIEVDSLYNQLAFIRKKMAKIEDSDSANQYKKLDAEANDLDAKLSRLWSDYAQQKKNLSITWNQVQENLSSDEAAIEFVRYKAEKDSLYHYNALIIRKNDVNPILVKLCTEKQLQKINPKEGFSSFYPLVWAPLEEYIKNIKTIYYSPIGLLNTIPFSALYSKKEEGEVVTFDKKTKQMVTTTEPDADFLMNKYTLHQLTSTRYLAMGLKDKALEKVESSITLVGGVNYDYLPGDKIEINKETEYASRGANSINPLKYLEGTKTEVETIYKTLKLNGWKTSLLKQNDATEENIEKLENQNAKGVLHIATHGFAFEDARGTSTTIDHASIKYNLSYNPDSMKRCGLIFAGGNWAWIGSDEFTKRNPDAEDGIVTAAQVALLNLKKTKLVVLSACETGLGKIVEGNEGVFGLKRAFKLAGVEQIIVSLWEVADKETMELMTLFYEDLVKTQNAIFSFEKAQKIMKDIYPTRPDLWAGFVLVR